MNTSTLRDVLEAERAKVRNQAKTYVLAGALLTLAAITIFHTANAYTAGLVWFVLLVTSAGAAVAAAVSVRLGFVVHRLADEFSQLAGVRDRVGPFVVAVDNPVVQSHDYGTRFSLATPARVRIERDPTWLAQ